MKFSLFKQSPVFSLKLLIFGKWSFKFLLSLWLQSSVISIQNLIFLLKLLIIPSISKLNVSLLISFLSLKSLNFSVSFSNLLDLIVDLSSKTFNHQLFFLHQVPKTDSFMISCINFFKQSVVFKDVSLNVFLKTFNSEFNCVEFWCNKSFLCSFFL